MEKLYHYRAYVSDVYDGDSITVDIDLGLGLWMTDQKIRLSDINAPEVRGEEREEGLKSKEWLAEKILDKFIMLRTIKDKKGKYGRWLGEIWFGDENINRLMVHVGMAQEVEY